MSEMAGSTSKWAKYRVVHWKERGMRKGSPRGCVVYSKVVLYKRRAKKGEIRGEEAEWDSTT